MFTAEDLAQTLRKISNLLSDLKVRHHFTGGLVSSFYGEPRLTQDIDIVVDPAAVITCLPDFLARIEGRYIFSPDVINSSLHAGSVFQLLDQESLIKIDLYPRQMVPGELERSIEKELLPGLFLKILNKEDAILAKLIWIRKGSHKSKKDVRMMLETSPLVDIPTLQVRAKELGILDILKQTMEEEPSLE